LQREIKNKTVTYGIAALLLVCILTATVYNFGIQPNGSQEPNVPPQPEAPPEPEVPSEPSIPSEPTAPSEPYVPSQPSLPPQPTIPTEPSSPPQPDNPPEFSELKTFTSYEELENFLNTNMEKAGQLENLPTYTFGGEEDRFTATDGQALAPEASPGEYSTTNVQVAGVDEADIVKTDGEYLYVVSGSYIYIMKAYPANQAELLSKIELDETYGAQIYVNENKLAVIGNTYPVYYTYAESTTEGEAVIPPYIYNDEMFVKVYDITNRDNPVLSRTVTVNGTLSGSRMIGNYVYAVVNQPATLPSYNEIGTEVVLPTISGNHVREVQPTEIRYIDIPDVSYRLTTIVAVNIMNDAQEPTYESFLTGYSTTLYVSLNNMYLVVPNTSRWFILEDGSEPREETLIYRIKLDQEKIVVMAEGSVSGYVLNQFSMDEYNSFFRIATTIWTNRNSTNSLYILDMNLNVVGKLEDLAPGEQIYSTRFMGDRCYLVTFRQIDPFFVIDIANPTQPKVLGYLKIPGFSGYLHPYDENHVIGIGKQDTNLKLSLFDVTDVTAPTETAKYIVQAEYSDSPVLYEHKAFLFDKTKQLLALPVSTNMYWIRDGNSGYWQGAYIFDISLEEGFTLEGKITHQNAAEQFEYNLNVNRILYIDTVLYTISNNKVKMNDLESLEPLNEINLP
jgi:inhibitor of cysteine peptidase